MAKFYDDDFERAWKTYGVRGSKAKAYEAWKKTGNLRPSNGLMLCCIRAYLEDLAAINKTRKPAYQQDKLHFSTFLSPSDMRWETYLERAEQLQTQENQLNEANEAHVAASGQTWPPDVLKALRLSDELLKVWILPCSFVAGSPPEIIAPRKFHANWLRERYIDKLQRVLGDGVKITYAS